MGRPPKDSREPVERYETIRHYIIALLKDYTISAKEISGYLKITEKDVYDHLEHIRRTIHKSEYHLLVKPAECEKCSFIFRKRGRLSKPGKCPICHGSLIIPPMFSVVKTHSKH